MDLSILGFVMARNEWPLLGLSVTHCLNLGVDHVVVLNHGSDDGTTEGLEAIRKKLPDQLTIIFLEDEGFFQEAATSLISQIFDFESYDWVYVFDADEFLLTSNTHNLKTILADVPDDVGVVRYKIDQWVAPSDIDEQNPKEFCRIVDRAIPNISGYLSDKLASDEIRTGNINFFDLQFPSKIILRGAVAHSLGAGSHRLTWPTDQTEIALDASLIRCGHLPFRSRQHLEKRKNQGRVLRRQGFPFSHGWQSQMILSLDRENLLDWFWRNHSIQNESITANFDTGARPSTIRDLSLEEALKAASKPMLELYRIDESSGKAFPTSTVRFDETQVPIGFPIKAIRNKIIERDQAIIERDQAIIERDQAIIEHDQTRKDLDLVMQSASWRWTRGVRTIWRPIRKITKGRKSVWGN